MNLSNTWLRVLGAVLAVATFLQLEANLSHSLHVAAACVVVGLTYLIGKSDEKEAAKDEVKL